MREINSGINDGHDNSRSGQTAGGLKIVLARDHGGRLLHVVAGHKRAVIVHNSAAWQAIEDRGGGLRQAGNRRAGKFWHSQRLIHLEALHAGISRNAGIGREWGNQEHATVGELRYLREAMAAANVLNLAGRGYKDKLVLGQ